MPRSRQQQGHAQLRHPEGRGGGHYDHGGTLPHRRPHSASAASNPVYDHLPARRNVRYDSMGNAMPLPSVPNHQQDPTYQTRGQVRQVQDPVYQSRTQAQQQPQEPVYQTRKQADPIYQTRTQAKEPIYQTRTQAKDPIYQTRTQAKEPIYQTRTQAKEPVYQTRAQTKESIYQTRAQIDREKLKSILYGSRERMLEEQHQHQSCEQLVDDNANEQQRRLSKPELRQFSREPTVIRLAQLDNEDNNPYGKYHINEIRTPTSGAGRGIVKDRDESEPQVQIQVKEATPTPQCKTPKTPLSPPRRSHSSSSPEWPPPPDPLGPTSPETPVINSGFDSNTLKRMLRSLPESSPENDNDDGVADVDNDDDGDDETDQGYAEGGCSCSIQQPRSTASSPIRGAHYQETHINHAPTSPKKIHSGPTSQLDLAHLPPHAAAVMGDHRSLHRPAAHHIKHHSMEYAGDYRAGGQVGGKTRDSYPDSGVSGMTDDKAGSVKSGDSGKSGRSSKSNTLPTSEYTLNLLIF